MQWLKTGLVVLVGVAVPVFATGCGGSTELKTALVHGKVTYNGQPVTGGSIAFAPVGESGAKEAGKPASGNVSPGGEYKLSTYGTDDGAVIGKHTVSYGAPSSEAPAAVPEGGHVPTKVSPYAGLVPKQKGVEVKAGDNALDIELVKGT